MTWREELEQIAVASAGDIGIYAALAALRRAENGKPGKEFGVLSVAAPTYEEQLRIARNSIKHHILRAIDKGIEVRRPDGFFTREFIEDFSRRWAPKGAENDPHGLNANHARNLWLLYEDFSGKVLHAMWGLSSA